MTAVSGTRGERSHNPGNLQFMPHSPWRGQVGIEIVPPGMSFKPRFGRYDTDHNGIRALAKQLITYYQRDGLRSVRAMINRYAPSSENATDSYVGAVCNYCGVLPDDDYPLMMLSRLESMVFAVIRQENGRVLYDVDQIGAACRDALGLPAQVASQP